jgi:hypothetical protein
LRGAKQWWGSGDFERLGTFALSIWLRPPRWLRLLLICEIAAGFTTKKNAILSVLCLP